jgi:hypothetical protein
MKKRMIKMFLLLTIIAVSIVYLHGFWAVNDPYSPFPPKASGEIGTMITDSASELLQSASEAFLFMNEVEIAGSNGLNVNAALQRVDLAAARIEHAMTIFKNIIAKGSENGYDGNRIKKLKDFDYGVYTKENGLNREIMAKVSAYLGKGNVIGFYRHHAANLQKLLNTLNRIKGDLLAGKLSENRMLWSLLQQYTNTMMVGNYASLVFYQI